MVTFKEELVLLVDHDQGVGL